MTRARCPHGHLDTCTPCLAAAHDRAVAAAEVRLHAAPPGDSSVVADYAFRDARDAREGFRLLRENGIAVIPTSDRFAFGQPCTACGAPIKHPRGMCIRLSCPGRRLRFQPPEVRGR